MSGCLSLSLSVWLSLLLPLCMSVCLPLPLYMSVCLPLTLPLCMSGCLLCPLPGCFCTDHAPYLNYLGEMLSTMTGLLLSAFCLLVNDQRVQLGMYEDSFDDQYVGCLDKMEAQAPDILRKERQKNMEFDNAWKNASETWLGKKSFMKTLPKGFNDEHGIALFVYSNMDIPVYKQLNRAIREYGMAPQSFMYYSLHFYLTRALTLLRAGCDGKPWSTYRGANRILFEPPPEPQHHIRLSQFASSSTDIKQAEQFGNASFFNITTCFGAEIHNFSYFPAQKEVLIPVDEVFHVTKYIKEGNRYNLQSTNKRCSFYNCVYLGGTKREICTYNSAPITLTFSEAVTAPLLVGLGIAVSSITMFLNR
ncbi:ecto-ADP-ribosyltransferase 5-like isoform X2 [Mixophyes fleayi]|uniref:ecto-ADP-ribosyltransferase 5-like isoform X2 n=1 Tax=Mixophyes fleayi TaxID=3061075 RepID=UPI003F4DF22F